MSRSMRSGHSSDLQPDRRSHRHQSWNTAVRTPRNPRLLRGIGRPPEQAMSVPYARLGAHRQGRTGQTKGGRNRLAVPAEVFHGATGRPSRTSSTGMPAIALAARCNVGVAAACPSVVNRARPSSSRSRGRGVPGGGGSARTARQISSRTSSPARCPATSAAPRRGPSGRCRARAAGTRTPSGWTAAGMTSVQATVDSTRVSYWRGPVRSAE